MIKNLRLAFGMMSKGYQYKLTLIGSVLFFVSGILNISRGSFFAGMFMLISGIVFIPSQVFMSVNLSGLVGASPKKKQLQSEVQSVLIFVLSLIAYGIALGAMGLSSFLAPETMALCWNDFLLVTAFMCLFAVYVALCGKLFLLSMVILGSVLILLARFMAALDDLLEEGLLLPLPLLLALSILFILAAPVLYYGVSCAVYRLPMSRYAGGWELKKYL